MSGQKLLLTFDREKARGHGNTWLMTLDWATKKIENKIIGKSALWAKGRTNSLIYKENLYRIAATKTNLDVDIFALDGTIKKAYSFKKEESIDIIDSPFFTENQENNGFYIFNLQKQKKIEKPSTKKLLNKLSKGTPFMSAEPFDENQILLTLGTFIISNNGGGFMPVMPGATINAPGALLICLVLQILFIKRAIINNLAFFYSRINMTNFEHSTEEEKETKAVHKFQNYVDNNFTKKHIYTLLPYEKNRAIIHYLRSEKLIKVDLFE